MNIQLVVLSTVFGLALFSGAVGLVLLARGRKLSGSRQRLQALSADEALTQESGVASAILRDTQMSSMPLVNLLLERLPFAWRLQLLLEQGDLSLRLGTFLAIMLGLALAGALLAVRLSDMLWMGLVGGVAGGAVPVYYAQRRKRKRIAKFEKQFPDALDILTGALRAGLAFSGAVQVVAEECPNPLAKEFTIVFEENRLGLDMKDAMRNLARRIDCAELRMFVTAVILQRETGGNLVEILENAAHIIRERFRILGEVRALTAQQRFSGMVLALLPLALAAFFLVAAPDYMRVLVQDPMGPYLILGALGLQIIGYLAIRRIVAIKV